ncbi:hypothetical protein CAPTEDRAFT_186372 [Capitella teleta]|uniref:LRRNT domain-containing protein n=1 Tax=Capitella teleta TaxID=283909 RepID=R7TZA0_CAPTE|nr:hypothetical protein CAPTEDRAFT_186372 [Capitella teleta]|eukprot:ELT98952.1 hypothetical protein CAPTEDRAFT_186372 [Capitella teleta]
MALWCVALWLFVSTVKVCHGSDDICGMCVCRYGYVDCSNMDLQYVPSFPSDTTILKLSRNRIMEIREKDFDKYPSLQYLFLDNNRMRTIHKNALLPLSNLTYLDLSWNDLSIQVLDNSVFSVLNSSKIEHLILSGMNFTLNDQSLGGLKKTHIRGIDFSWNREICDLPNYTFSNMQELRMVSFRYCNCYEFNPLTFINTSLEFLDFGYNHLWKIPEIQNTTFLQILRLEKNAIMDVPGETWLKFSSLHTLNLSSNSLYTIHDDLVQNLDKLETLDLRGNRIETLSDHPFKSTSLRVLHLEDNPVTFSFIYHHEVFREAVYLRELYLGKFETVDFMFEILFTNLTYLEVLHIENVQRFTAITRETFQNLPRTHLEAIARYWTFGEPV